MNNKKELFSDINIFKTIFDQSYNSIVITDAQIELPGPQFLYVNEAFTKITGYTLEELKGKTPRILQGKNTDMDLIAKLKKSLQNDEYFSGSTINYTKDGKEYFVEWNISPIKDENGKTIYFTSVQKNITEKIMFERKIKEEQSKKNIALRKVAINEILERIAHHWRQHLSIISSATLNIQVDYELNGSLDKDIDTTLDNLSVIDEETQKLSNIIKEFQDFSKDKGEDKQDINIKIFIEEVLSLYSLDREKNNIDVKVDIPEDIVLFANKQEVTHLILPIIDNSIYFLKKNDIQEKKIDISAHINNDLIYIKIEDNANGIDEKIIEYIFDAYYSTKDEKNDTGLGLYIARNTAEEVFNGSLNIKNSENGAIADIIIPL